MVTNRAGGAPPPADSEETAAPATLASAGGNPLQRLILDRLAERGWSYGQVGRRGALSRHTVYNLATTAHLGRPPRAETIEKLATGLDVPVSVVQAAAVEASGLHYGEISVDQETAVLIASIDELTPEDRRVVAALVDSLRSRVRGQPNSAGERTS